MGVDAVFEEETRLRDHIRSGQFRLHRGDIPEVCVGAGLAHKLGLNPRFVTPLEIYYPSRTRKPSMANPLNTLNYAKVYPTGTFSVNNDIDQQYIVLPIEKMRELLEYESEVSAVQVRLGFWAENQNIEKKISQIVGEDFVVKDRYRQNENLYKMMKYEKISIWLILVFIIIIIAFNIFGSLSMLIIEKKFDIGTLRSMGAQESLIKRIFILEGWFISLAGLAAGLLVGTGFSLLQQHFGFIKMPGHFVVQAYPIILSWSDILLTVVGVAAIGYLIALLPVASYYRKEK
jgi:ABC-type lipoprotein release transport system permease subunit